MAILNFSLKAFSNFPLFTTKIDPQLPDSVYDISIIVSPLINVSFSTGHADWHSIAHIKIYRSCQSVLVSFCLTSKKEFIRWKILLATS